MSGAARKHRSPLQGFGPFPTPTQGDALGWNGSAPLRLKTYPADRRPVLASRPCRPRSRNSQIGTGFIPASGVRQMRMVRCMAGWTHDFSPSGASLNDLQIYLKSMKKNLYPVLWPIGSCVANTLISFLHEKIHARLVHKLRLAQFRPLIPSHLLEAPT